MQQRKKLAARMAMYDRTPTVQRSERRSEIAPIKLPKFPKKVKRSSGDSWLG